MKRDLVILSGISGAGKSTATFAFEEMGYNCIHNLPAFLLPSFFNYISSKDNNYKYEKTLITVNLDSFLAAKVQASKVGNLNVDSILLYCEKEELFKRYKFTRHSHPLQVEGISLEEALDKEANIYSSLKDDVGLNINTTKLNVTNLRKILFTRYLTTSKENQVVCFVSFGFKNGAPKDADIVFDLRLVPNPYYIAELKNQTGLDKCVQDYLAPLQETNRNMNLIRNYLDEYLPSAVKDNRGMIIVALGCTGGQHRSVYFAQKLSEHYKDKFHVHTIHRDIKR